MFNSSEPQALLRKIAKIAHLIAPLPPRSRPGISSPTVPSFTKVKIPGSPLLVIGCSTGGPNALTYILSRLPSNFNAAIALIQHIDEKFAPSLADWLDRHSSQPVTLARSGMFAG
ncbi:MULTISPECIES: chemotaxis protein CheB [Spirulina sp. CCY15215]|uniref:chemotaxis protein CheB n=1 Tax=Spirulina sp. CCY15215 TaxID=2767591 RepID=UPI0019510F61|nr:chemotaxis protein CheB [Spirulina major]